MKPTAASSTSGMALVDLEGNRSVDMSAALASSLGHRHPGILNAIVSACDEHVGAPHDLLQDEWCESLGAVTTGFKRSLLFPSADEANEAALRLVRSFFGGDRFRVISLLGSNHGDTFLLRSASGRIESQGSDGPVAAGFRHVLPGDIKRLPKPLMQIPLRFASCAR
jgi:acetylornithine/succinyldiaminopimelate/putrescine aminotransferase